MYKFKDRWCNEKNPIHYYFYARDDKGIPALKNAFSLYKLYGKVWSKLPKCVIKKISPFIIRQFI